MTATKENGTKTEYQKFVNDFQKFKEKVKSKNGNANHPQQLKQDANELKQNLQRIDNNTLVKDSKIKHIFNRDVPELLKEVEEDKDRENVYDTIVAMKRNYNLRVSPHQAPLFAKIVSYPFTSLVLIHDIFANIMADLVLLLFKSDADTPSHGGGGKIPPHFLGHPDVDRPDPWRRITIRDMQILIFAVIILLLGFLIGGRLREDIEHPISVIALERDVFRITPTPSPTHTSTPSPTSTPTITPTPRPRVIENWDVGFPVTLSQQNGYQSNHSFTVANGAAHRFVLTINSFSPNADISDIRPTLKKGNASIQHDTNTPLNANTMEYTYLIKNPGLYDLNFSRVASTSSNVSIGINVSASLEVPPCIMIVQRPSSFQTDRDFTAPVYSDPDTSSLERIAAGYRLTHGTTVVVVNGTDNDGGWYEIKYPTGLDNGGSSQTGWIQATYLRMDPEEFPGCNYNRIN